MEETLGALSRGRQDSLPLLDAIGLPHSVLKIAILRARKQPMKDDLSHWLSGSEQLLVALCHQTGGVIRYAQAREALVESGKMKRVTLDKTLSHSPIFVRITHGVYRLTGWPVPPENNKNGKQQGK